MPIRNSFSVLLCNFKLVYKLLLFIFVVVLIGSAICFSILGPVFDGYFDEVRGQFDYEFDNMAKHPITTIQHLLQIFMSYITDNSTFINLRLLYISIIFIGIRFLISLPMVPVAKVLYSKMTTNFDQGLFNAFVGSLPQSLLFSAVTSFVFGIIDLALFIGLILLAILLIQVVGFVALPLCLALAIFIFSLRTTIVSQWLPEIARNGGKKIFTALKTSFKPAFKNFSKNIICITVFFVFLVTAFMMTAIPTFGLVPILLIPTSMVYYISLNIALNFSYNKQKYFTDNGVTIYDPTKLF